MKKEIDGKVYIEVDSLNELLDKANLYYNPETGELTGTAKEAIPEWRPTARIGKKLPPPDEVGMLDEFMGEERVLQYTTNSLSSVKV